MGIGNIQNPYQTDYTGLVDQQLGTAYLVVREMVKNLGVLYQVSNYMPQLVAIGDAIESLLELEQSLPTLKAIIEKLDELKELALTFEEALDIKDEIITVSASINEIINVSENMDAIKNVGNFAEEAETSADRAKLEADRAELAANNSDALVLRTDLSTSEGSELVGYRQELPGSLHINIKDRILGEVTLRDFGGIGKGEDATLAFQKAASATTGSGISVRVFAGTYKIKGIVPVDSCIFVFDEGVVLDCTESINTGVFTVNGGVGPEIKIGANIDRGDNIVTSATPHGLSVGDWFLLKSQRSCSHADAGEHWRLGTLTDAASPVYFAEPLQVKEVISDTQIITTTDVIFPDYRIDKLNETLVGGREFSTIRKINFSTTTFIGSPKVKAPLVYGQVFNLNWAHSPVVEMDVDFDINSGGAIYSRYVYNGLYTSRARRPLNWTLNGEDHSRYNSFRDVSSWYCQWNLVEWFGSQCWDQTYSDICSIYPRVKIRSYSPMEQGATTHGNTYGVRMDVEVVNHKRTGVSNRARFAEIYARTEGIKSSAASMGVTLHEWGQQNATVKVYSMNNQYAVSFQKSSLSQTASPQSVVATISGTVINPVLGAVNFGNRVGAPLVPSNIRLHDWILSNVPRFIYALSDSYWNGIEVDGVVGTGDGVQRSGAFMLFVDNSAYHTVRNVNLRNVGTESLIRAPRMPDSDLNNISGRQSINIEWESVAAQEFSGNWVDGFLGVPAVSRMQDAVSMGRFNRIVVCNANNSVTNRELVLNGGTSHALPVGSWLEFIANGTGVPYVTAGDGVTLTGSSAGMDLGKSLRIYRVSTNIYNVSVR